MISLARLSIRRPRVSLAQLVPILLEGPKQQLNIQGPKLVAVLSARPHTRVLSAWDAGTASAGLRPKPTAAMIVVSVDRSEKNVVHYDEPQIEHLVARDISAPASDLTRRLPRVHLGPRRPGAVHE